MYVMVPYRKVDPQNHSSALMMCQGDICSAELLLIIRMYNILYSTGNPYGQTINQN